MGARRTPAGRWGKVEDLVGALLFLVAPASGFVNGQVVYVDGGMLLRSLSTARQGGALCACVVHGPGDLRVDELADPGSGRSELARRVRRDLRLGPALLPPRRGGRLPRARADGARPRGRRHRRRHGEGARPAPGRRRRASGAAVRPLPRVPGAAGRTSAPTPRYLGSAARFPHVQGGFCAAAAVPADAGRPLPDGPPLQRRRSPSRSSVALHAVRGPATSPGSRVLVTGPGRSAASSWSRCAPPAPLGRGQRPRRRGPRGRHGGGADDVSAPTARRRPWPAERTSSSRPPGGGRARPGVARVRRGGTVVRLGLLPPGDTPFPGNLLVTREIDLAGPSGSRRARRRAGAPRGRSSAAPVITHVRPLAEAP